MKKSHKHIHSNVHNNDKFTEARAEDDDNGEGDDVCV